MRQATNAIGICGMIPLMDSLRRTRSIYFFSLAAIGVITAWLFNGLAVMRGEDYLKAWFGTSVDWVLSADLLIVAIAGSSFMIIEGRRLGMRRIWLYLVLAGITAMAFVFPLFLAMRERALARLEAASGKIETFHLDNRRIDVLVPADLGPDTPVLVMHDGKGLLVDKKLTWNGQNWQIPEAISSGRVKAPGRTPLVVGVFIDETKGRFNELAPEDILARHPEFWTQIDEVLLPADRTFRGNDYQDFLASRLLPSIAEKYGIELDRNRTAIGGASMGGLATLYALGRHPEVWGAGLAVSTHWPLGGEVMASELAAALPIGDGQLIWQDCGTLDVDAPYLPVQLKFVEALEKRGLKRDVDFAASVFAGTGHNENWWAARVHLPINWWLNR